MRCLGEEIIELKHELEATKAKLAESERLRAKRPCEEVNYNETWCFALIGEREAHEKTKAEAAMLREALGRIYDRVCWTEGIYSYPSSVALIDDIVFARFHTNLALTGPKEIE